MPQQILLSIGFGLAAIMLKNLFIMLSLGLGHWLSYRLQADLRRKAKSLLMCVGLEFHHHAKAAELIEKALGHTANMELFMRTFIELTANLLTLLVLVVASAMLDHTFSPLPPEVRMDRTLHVSFMAMRGEGSEWSGSPGHGFLDRYCRDIPHVERMSVFTGVHAAASFVGGEKVVSRTLTIT